jgi:RNA polymerase sigma-70 factor (ECF subfamily)
VGSEDSATVSAAITRAHQNEWSRVVASLAKRFGDLDIAEEAAAEAFATAVERWPADGIPPNPGGWLTVTATRKAIDRIRRENKRDDKYREAMLVFEVPNPHEPLESLGAIDDERLRLMFTCCHPALAMDARVALTLRMVGGLTMAEIARAFLVQESTMARRITRAKDKIKAAGIPFSMPVAADLPARVSGVLAVLFLVFNEGYLATGPSVPPVRAELTGEAIRLTRLLLGLLTADGRVGAGGGGAGGAGAGGAGAGGVGAGGVGDGNVGEVSGMLALMLLTEARRAARVSAGGELVTLDEQDRGAWSPELIAEGHALVRARLASGVAPGRYQLLAAINAVHTSARDIRDTDWAQIAALYDQLLVVDPSPIVALNRAVAVAELDGPEVALALVDGLSSALDGYHAYHATRADLLRRTGRSADARAAYGRAIELAGNTAEAAYLTRRREQLG